MVAERSQTRVGTDGFPQLHHTVKTVLELTVVNLAQLADDSHLAFVAVFQFDCCKRLKGLVQFFRKLFQQRIHVLKLANVGRVVVQGFLIVLEHTHIIHNTAKFL